MWTHGVKCASDSRDVSGIVADAEVLLEVHGFVGGAELEERRRGRCEREASILSHLYGRHQQRDR